VFRVWLTGSGRLTDRLQSHQAHAPAHPVTASGQAIATQVPLHLPRAIKRVFEKGLINPPHQRKVGFTLAFGPVIHTGPAQGDEFALTARADIRVADA